MRRKKNVEMSARVSSFSDLIQRVTASCLLHPLAGGRHDSGQIIGNRSKNEEEEEDVYDYESDQSEEVNQEGEDRKGGIRGWERERTSEIRVKEMVILMNDVFDAVSTMKKAYVSLQEAHCPWDPERMRVADVAVVGELRRLAVLRERFRRGVGDNELGRICSGGGGLTREVVAPYEAAVEELKRELKAREVEIENLKSAAHVSNGGNGKKGRFQSKRKVNCSIQGKSRFLNLKAELRISIYICRKSHPFITFTDEQSR